MTDIMERSLSAAKRNLLEAENVFRLALEVGDKDLIAQARATLSETELDLKRIKKMIEEDKENEYRREREYRQSSFGM